MFCQPLALSWSTLEEGDGALKWSAEEKQKKGNQIRFFNWISTFFYMK
jgi:hypothetical protein